MKRTSANKRLTSILLVAALCVSLLGNVSPVVFAQGEPTGDTYVYLPVKDLSNASRYGGSTIVADFLDQDIGGTPECGNRTLLLQSPSDYVEYDFDLDDTLTEAVLKVYAKHAAVSVKVGEGDYQPLTAKNGAAANRGVNLFDLTRANALSGSDNKFTLRIGVQGEAVVLNALAVMGSQPEQTGEFSVDAYSEAYLQSVVDVSSTACRYFLNGTIPTVFLHNGEYVTLRFDYADNAARFAYGYDFAGAPLTAEVSTNGTDWVAVNAAGGVLDDYVTMPGNNVFYLRFSAQNGESFLRNVTLRPASAYWSVEKTRYIPMNDLSGVWSYGGSGIAQNYNDTAYSGADSVENRVMLLGSGDYVEYAIDLADDVTAATLKLYASTVKVEVKPQGGDFIPLTPKNGTAFDRNVAFFDLTAGDALAADSNRFILRLSFSGSTGILKSLLVQTEEQELTETYTLDLLGENYLRQLADVSAGASRYFLNSTIPTVFLHTGEQVTFHFDFDDSVEGIQLEYTQAGAALTAQVSANGSDWTDIVSGAKVGDTIALGSGMAFYARFTSPNGEGFLSGLTVTPDAATFADAGKELYLSLADAANASKSGGTGLLSNYNDTAFSGADTLDNKVLLLQNSGDFVEYNIDLADDVSAAVLKLYATGGKVEVKPQGGDFTTLTAKNGTAFDRNVAIYELNSANALSGSGNRFTVRVSHNGGTAILKSLLVQAQEEELTGTYTLDLLGKNYLQQVCTVSSGASRYFLDGTVPTVFLHTGEQVTFHFDFGDSVESIQLAYTQAGAALTAQVSANGTDWADIASGAKVEDTTALGSDRAFYVRFTSPNGEGFLSGLTLTPASDPYKEAGEELYLELGDVNTAEKHGGTGIASNYNDTALSGAETLDNKVLLLQHDGDFVEYNLDLDDSVATALLKLYISGGKVEVKPEGGAFTTLTPKNGTRFDRNVAIYELNASNALSTGTKRFTLRISSTGETVILKSLLVQAKEAELTGTYTLDLLGKNYLQQVYTVSSGAGRYFLNGTVPTVYLHTAESVVFHFDYESGTESLRLDFTQAGAALTAQVSADGSTWTDIVSGALVENTITLGSDRAFYVRFTSPNGEGFLSGLTVTPIMPTVEEKEYIYLDIHDLSDASRFSGATIVENFVDTYADGNPALMSNPTLLLQANGEYVEYDINLPDSVTAATMKIYMKDGVVSVKPAGGSYTTLTAANARGGRFDRNVAIYNLTTSDALASSDRCFTVRIACGGEAVVLNALLIQQKPAERSNEFVLDLLGENYLQNVHTVSQGASRYFADQKDPCLFLHNGESVTFAFDFADSIRGFTYSYVGLGQPLTGEISTDLTTWNALPSGGRLEDLITLNESVTFYVRFTANAGDSFLKSLKITPAEPEVIREEDYVYRPIHDLSGTSGYGGAGIVENFRDTYTGGSDEAVNNPTLLLERPGDYVEYTFNLTDSKTSALLKVYMTDAVVSVKPYGGSYVTLTARNEQGGRFNRGVAIYDLTTANALSDPGRRFTVRIASNGSATAVLNGLLVDAGSVMDSGTYRLEPLGESFLQGLWDISQNTSRYFYQESEPTVFIQNGGYATFRMNFLPGGACYLATYETVGAPATVEVSLDGSRWVPLEGERVDLALDMTGTGTYYIRFSAKDGESFLRSLNTSRETVLPPEKINTNPNRVKDQTYVYFKVGTADEVKYMFGMGDDFEASFLSTHEGMSIDGFEGGYSSSLPKNARLFHGGSVTYEFDLADSISAANLKVYGLGEMRFRVSTDKGETFSDITPQFAPLGNGRGYYIFRLDESNALSGGDNAFRLEISGTYGILMSLMIDTGAPTVYGGVHMEINNEAGLRYLEESVGLRTYYADEAFANYYLDENGYLIFKVPVAQGNSSILYATYSGDVHISVATSRYGHYEPVLNSVIGPSGTPHTNTFALSRFLQGSGDLYILVTGSAQGGFLDSIGIATAPGNAASGSVNVFTASEAAYLYGVTDNAQGVGSSKRVTVNLQKARAIDVGGSVIYRLNLPDDVNGVDFKLQAVGNYELTVSTDGENFVSVTQVGKKTDGVRILEPLADSKTKELYVKIRNMSSSDDLILYGFTFTTKGLPNYARPETADFDYNKALPDSFPGVEKLERAAEPEPYSASTAAAVGIWVWILAGAGIVAAGIVTAIVLVSRGKKKKRN